MTQLTNIAGVCGSISTAVSLALLLVRPLRKWALGLKQIEDGQKCLLRADMLRTYYRHREEKAIRQYEYQNFILAYEAYTALGGNSFIKEIHDVVVDWEVLP